MNPKTAEIRRESRDRLSTLEKACRESLQSALRGEGWGIDPQDVQESAGAHDFTVRATKRGSADLVLAVHMGHDARQDSLRTGLYWALNAPVVHVLGSGDEHVVPVGVVAAPSLSERMLDALEEDFTRAQKGLAGLSPRYAKRVGWGAIDGRGRVRLRISSVPALAHLDLEPRAEPRRRATLGLDVLASDLGQRCLKLALAERLDESFLTADRGPIRTAGHLGTAAGTSSATGVRVARWLGETGFLEAGSSRLRIVRARDLMAMWGRRMAGEAHRTRACWALPTSKPRERLADGLRRLAGKREHAAQFAPPVTGRRGGMQREQPRACIAGAWACESHGASVVIGDLPRLYLKDVGPDHFSEATLDLLGLRPAGPRDTPDIELIRPPFPHSIFDSAVVTDDRTPMADAIQCWLDIMQSGSHVRGNEQSRALERGPLKGLFAE